MQVTGIVVEYNPFHNGHLYHLKKAREQTKADIVIAVMSGSFVQRGEPAIISKWARTEMALLGGCDLVIELPVAYSSQQADIFSYYSVLLLNNLGITDLFFGSESGDSDIFQYLGSKITAENEAFQSAFQLYSQDKTISYARALTLSLKSLVGDKLLDVSQPNNILALHYAISAAKLNPHIRLHTLKRTTAFHEEQPIKTRVTSATAIRKLLLAGDLLSAAPFLPPFSQDILLREKSSFLSFQDVYPLLQYRLLTDDKTHLKKIVGVTEGIENRFLNNCLAGSAEEFLHLMTTKRYSTSRIKRTAIQILLQHEKTQQTLSQPYLRLLGMNKQGQTYLHFLKKNLSLPFVATFSKAPKELVALDLQATHVYGLMATNEELMKSDFTTPPLRK